MTTINSLRIIEDITNFIFVEDSLREADIIFIPGSSKAEPSEKASDIYKAGLAKFILPSGKYSSKLASFPNEKIIKKDYLGVYETDWHFCSEVLKKNGVPEKAILKEILSTNTYENSFFSREVTDLHGMTIKTAIICCQAFHARRTLMTYSWAYPETDFIIVPTDTQNISRKTWYQSDYGVNRVLGELKRCGAYFGDYFIQK